MTLRMAQKVWPCSWWMKQTLTMRVCLSVCLAERFLTQSLCCFGWYLTSEHNAVLCCLEWYVGFTALEFNSRSDKPLIPVIISPWLDSQSLWMLTGSYPLSWRNLSVMTLRMAQRCDHLIKERSEQQSESFSLSVCLAHLILCWFGWYLGLQHLK